MRKNFNCPIGFSDHTNDIKTSIYSSILGAQIIEKHFMASNKSKCVDAPVSIDPIKFKKMRYEIDNLKRIISTPKFGLRPEEKKALIFKRKKIL